MNRTIKLTLLLFSLGSIQPGLEAQDQTWNKIDEGLEMGEFASPVPSVLGESVITIIRIDPGRYSFRLLCCDELGHSKLTAVEWTWKYNLVGAVNAGMFLSDHKTNVGYMKNFEYLNNPKINSSYHSVVAFNPVDTVQDPFEIFDIDETDIQDISAKYHTVIQNLRLIKSPGQNRWSQQDRKWSELALGQDKHGNALLIFSRSPYSMHDLNNILISLPIDIDNAQHLEGGPEASLYISHQGTRVENMGSYESGFNENDQILDFWPIPNVIGIVRK